MMRVQLHAEEAQRVVRRVNAIIFWHFFFRAVHPHNLLLFIGYIT